MASDSRVEIRVSADTAGAKGDIEGVAGALDGLGSKQEAIGSAAQASAAKQGPAYAAMREGAESVGAKLESLKSQIAAVFGVTLGAGLIKDLAATADAYQTLSARIKLVTGDGAAFADALSGVQRVALATRSDLTETANLFAKLSEAGRSLGVSQAEALRLTETVNQAIQLSGGSAESAKAAITQLVQGLQSGVLRGDEFNSVMEQSPRLAKALADGLGVTTGELRKMAEAGQLSSASVIEALRGQGAAVEAQFRQLPATVGGALQNLSSQWTVYIGQVDQANGISAAAANAIEFLAGNLRQIGDVAMTAGKGVAALYALDLAQRFGDWAIGAGKAAAGTSAAAASAVEHAAATKADSAAIQANTAATAENTAARRANAASASTAATAIGGLGAEVARTGAAKAEAASKAGLLSLAWGGLRGAASGLLNLIGGPLGLIVLTATYAKDIGELTAKLVLKARGMRRIA